jgi:Leucine-rich repeat (LRR) protein
MNNELTGSLKDDAFEGFANLGYMGLDGNKLQGGIPNSVGAMTSLTELIVWGNRMTGTLPAALNKCTSLTTLSASANALHGAGLTGTIPDLSALTNLEALYIQENAVTGTLPASLGRLAGMKRMWINDNKVTISFTHTPPNHYLND